MSQITLPPQINAGGLLPFLAALELPGGDEVALDFAPLRRVTPAGLVALAAAVARWRAAGRAVRFRGVEECAITGYLQRMDALRICGIERPERFRRHEARGRFVPVREVAHRTEEMGREMAECLAPGGEDLEHPHSGLFDLVVYVLTEVGNNIRQHSGGKGFAAAQVSREEGLVRLALADNGMGIRGSFQRTGTPWSFELSDGAAIVRALEPHVSCKAGEPNEGVGLTLVAGLMRLMQGWLLLVSGSGVVRIAHAAPPVVEALPGGGHYEGTLVVMSFRQLAASDYARLLHEAKAQAGLLRARSRRATFEP